MKSRCSRTSFFFHFHGHKKDRTEKNHTGRRKIKVCFHGEPNLSNLIISFCLVELDFRSCLPHSCSWENEIIDRTFPPRHSLGADMTRTTQRAAGNRCDVDAGLPPPLQRSRVGFSRRVHMEDHRLSLTEARLWHLHDGRRDIRGHVTRRRWTGFFENTCTLLCNIAFLLQKKTVIKTTMNWSSASLVCRPVTLNGFLSSRAPILVTHTQKHFAGRLLSVALVYVHANKQKRIRCRTQRNDDRVNNHRPQSFVCPVIQASLWAWRYLCIFAIRNFLASLSLP